MKVSLIIPVYNTAPYIERCLYSVLRQSYDNIEIILVDDYGTDNSMVLATRLLKTPSGENARPIAEAADHPGEAEGPEAEPSQGPETAPKQAADQGPEAKPPQEPDAAPPRSLKILHHTENRGLSAARNTGLEAATGDYVFFLDSDDELPPRAIENLVRTAHLYSHPHLVCGRVDVLPHNNKALEIKEKLPDYIEGNVSSSTAILRRDIPIMACNKLVKREFLQANGLYFKEGLIHEDNLWSFQMAGPIHNIAINRQVTYLYHLNKKGLTLERVTPQRMESIKTILTTQIEMLAQERPLRTLQQAYIIFTAAWFRNLLYEQSHAEFYKMQQWIRTTLRPFGREIHYHNLKSHLLYRALFLPPGLVRTGKNLRDSAQH
ncbi:MAG TPA: glycosyltransferase [Bacteroidales bacterium]|nr:glycosyltransferase [Bacteroidales bacterium]